MTAPNIKAIMESLRNITLGGKRAAESQLQRLAPEEPHQAAPQGKRQMGEQKMKEFAGVTVELNSDVALPYYWEQCLDLMTGQIYYINWKDGTRTTDDPRLTTTSHSWATYYTSEEDETSDDGVDEEAAEEDEECGDAEDSSSMASDCADYGDCFGISNHITSGVLMDDSDADVSPGGNVLVAAGCRSCFMYFMVPKLSEDCPKCGGCLLHLGRSSRNF